MIEELNEFDEIRPYSDEEAARALSAVANHPAVLVVSRYLFPKESPFYLRKLLKQINSIDEFQVLVMKEAVEWVLKNTVTNFSYDGIERMKELDCKSVMLSNHRDIILDPAITQVVLYRNGLKMTEIAVGDNLLSNKYIEFLIRSNRMIKVIRGISARTLYLSSQLLSRYIRQSVTSEKSSIWIAQREGRTKNGLDATEQGLLKMLDMSGQGDFVSNFAELNIMPLSISYEYEPCDILKARELLISRTQKYVKGPKEDMHSIMMGIKQQKGNVHLHFGEPLSIQEIEEASKCSKNDRYQYIRHAVDLRVIEGYKLWKTNYMAYDLVNGGNKYAEHYSAQDLVDFKAYVEHKLSRVERRLNRDELRDIFLHIYSNPVLAKENLKKEKEGE